MFIQQRVAFPEALYGMSVAVAVAVAIFQVGPLGCEVPWGPGSGTEIMPVKDSHTRLKPLTLAGGHGRFMLHARTVIVTSERKLTSVGEWPLHIAVINI
jgi:hypothetical protein